jgi:hypothetical protein
MLNLLWDFCQLVMLFSKTGKIKHASNNLSNTTFLCCIMKLEDVNVCMCAYVYLFTFFNFLIGEHCKRKLGINCFQKTVQTVEYYTLNIVFSES